MSESEKFNDFLIRMRRDASLAPCQLRREQQDLPGHLDRSGSTSPTSSSGRWRCHHTTRFLVLFTSHNATLKQTRTEQEHHVSTVLEGYKYPGSRCFCWGSRSLWCSWHTDFGYKLYQRSRGSPRLGLTLYCTSGVCCIPSESDNSHLSANSFDRFSIGLVVFAALVRVARAICIASEFGVVAPI